MPLELTAFPAERPGQRHVLREGGRFLLGRSPQSDLVVPDPRVSSRHLVIDGRGGSWRLIDQGSKNGSRLNGRPLDTGSLKGAAWLSLGGVPAFAEQKSEEATRADEHTRNQRRTAAAAAASAVSGTLSARALLARCLDGVLQLSNCERASIWILDGAGRPAPLMSRGAAQPPVSRGTVQSVIAGGEFCVVSDTAGAEAAFRRESIERGGIRALVVLPLDCSGRRLGALYADSLRPGKTFTDLDLELMAALAAEAAVALGLTRLKSELDHLAQRAALPS